MPGGRRSPQDTVLRQLVRLQLTDPSSEGLSLDEAVHRSALLSRRSFLRAGGLAGAGLTLAACTGADSPESAGATTPAAELGDGPRVVIVGAGLAGLTTAFRLHQAGVRTTVHEARDRVGGRCWSSADWRGGQIGEHGGEFIDTRHVHLLGLARELGLTIDDLWSTWEPGATSLTWVDGQDVDAKVLTAPIREASRALAEQAQRMGSYLAGEAGRAARAFDQLTEAEWVTETTGESIDSPMGRLFSSSQAGWYGLDADRLGAANLIDFYAIDWPGGDERYTIHGGNDLIPQGLAAALPPGTITLESALESVRSTGADTYELRFTNSDEPVVADYLVLTVPFSVLQDVDVSDAGFSATKRAAIDQLGMGTNSKVLLQFDQPLRSFDNWSSYLQRADEPQFSTWESSSTDNPATEQTLLTLFAGGRAGTAYDTDQAHGQAPADVADQMIGALDEMVPGIAAAHTGDSWLDFWAQDPWARGSYAAFLPGNTTAFLGIMGEPEGRAHFAGEHTSVYSQGFLNGGAESGSRVAAELLDALDRPYPPGLSRALRAQQQYQPVYPWG